MIENMFGECSFTIFKSNVTFFSLLLAIAVDWDEDKDEDEGGARARTSKIEYKFRNFRKLCTCDNHE